ncbi:MAG: hypothetical protein RBS78_00985 [Coriobacteriia bacterium]|jgi:hypothetical protein|nr:hypothetical protein [Coriobacteriia bacterium]
MATRTVLEYVQQCLSTMDSDLVDSINETAEAVQVADLLRENYLELMNRQDWEFLKRAVTLTPAADPAMPTRFDAPQGLRKLSNLWYNVSESGVSRRELKYVDPVEFLNRLASGDAESNKVLTTYGTQLQFYVRNDRMPTFYTTFDDRRVFLDSYDASVEATVQGNRVSAWGVVIPDFVVEDGHTPDLPEHMVPLLQATLNSTAHLYFKQQASAPDEARVRRQLAQARKRNSIVADREHYYVNNFGRR